MDAALTSASLDAQAPDSARGLALGPFDALLKVPFIGASLRPPGVIGEIRETASQPLVAAFRANTGVTLSETYQFIRSQISSQFEVTWITRLTADPGREVQVELKPDENHQGARSARFNYKQPPSANIPAAASGPAFIEPITDQKTQILLHQSRQVALVHWSPMAQACWSCRLGQLRVRKLWICRDRLNELRVLAS